MMAKNLLFIATLSVTTSLTPYHYGYAEEFDAVYTPTDANNLKSYIDQNNIDGLNIKINADNKYFLIDHYKNLTVTKGKTYIYGANFVASNNNNAQPDQYNPSIKVKGADAVLTLDSVEMSKFLAYGTNRNLHAENGTLNIIDGNLHDNGGSTYTQGGAVAIAKEGKSDILNGKFSENVVNTAGGAIHNQGEIKEISGSFEGNKVENTKATAWIGGSAIYNQYSSGLDNPGIGEIKADFINNISETSLKAEVHGAIRNQGSSSSSAKIDHIASNFTGNVAKITGDKKGLTTDRPEARGGAIGNKGIINEISGEIVDAQRIRGLFLKNQATYEGETEIAATGGAIYNANEINNLSTLEFRENRAEGNNVNSYGGAIHNEGAINTIKDSTFENNTVSNKGATISGGGAIAVYKNSNNTAADKASIDTISNATFKENKAVALSEGGKAYGGAIMIGQNASKNQNIEKINKIVNSEFVNNTAQADNGTALGGAILSNNDLTLEANAGNVLFRGNKTINGNKEENNGIYMLTGTTDKTLTLNALNGGQIIMDDTINGSEQNSSSSGYYKIAVNGDAESEVQLNNMIKNASKLTLEGTKLTIGSQNTLDAKTDLSLNSGQFNLQNNEIQNVYANTLSSNENAVWTIDADLDAGEADKIIATDVAAGSKIKLSSVNILADGKQNIQIVDSADGSNPQFTNLDNLRTFTVNYKYKFADNGDGSLRVENRSSTSNQGLNGAVNDTEEYKEKTYSVSDSEDNVIGDLGDLQGNGTKLIILGNGNELDGKNFAGIKLSQGQEVQFDRVSQVKNFNSEKGGVINNNGGVLNIHNTSFINNTAKQGGAIYTTGDVNISASGADVLFAGNKVVPDKNKADNAGTDGNNAIYAADKDASINLIANNGTIRFDDSIDGEAGYNITVSGSPSEYRGNEAENSGIIFNNHVNNLGWLTVNSSKVKLGDESFLDGASINLDGGHLDLANGQLGVMNLANYYSNNGLLSIDVDPLQGRADELVIGENASGHTRLYVNTLNSGKPTDKILFATIKGSSSNGGNTPDIDEGDTDDPFGEPDIDDGDIDVPDIDEGNAQDPFSRSAIFAATPQTVNDASFEVWRVAGSPYLWETSFDEDAQKWYLNTSEKSPALAAEMMGYFGLQSAGYELNRNLLQNVQNKVDADKVYYNCCGYYDEHYNAQNLYNLWVSPSYNTVKIRNVADYDADISGIEAGGDIVSDANNRLGMFLSYRQGDFDFNGHGKYFNASTKTDVDIDSYGGGLYYNYTDSNWWAWAGIYGSYLDVNLNTKDGVKASTDGYAFGSRISSGYNFALAQDWHISPLVSLSYTWLHYDDFNDNAGKSIEYDDFSAVEAELGLKLEKQHKSENNGYFKYYVQPSIIRNIYYNNDVKISNFTNVPTQKDQTLGKVEIGARASLGQNWTTYINADHTFGKGYSNSSVLLGLNYAL